MHYMWVEAPELLCLKAALKSPIRPAGISAKAYHAGLKDAVRGQVLRDWSSGVVPVVVATIAFGMGIDRASRFLSTSVTVPNSSMTMHVQVSAGEMGKPETSTVGCMVASSIDI